MTRSTSDVTEECDIYKGGRSEHRTDVYQVPQPLLVECLTARLDSSSDRRLSIYEHCSASEAMEGLDAHARRTTASQAVWEDAMLLEMADAQMVPVPGSSRNVHVVTQEDLELAQMYAAAQPFEVRTGSG